MQVIGTALTELIYILVGLDLLQVKGKIVMRPWMRIGEDLYYLSQRYPRRLSNKHMGFRFQEGSFRLIKSLVTLNFDKKSKTLVLSVLLQIWNISCDCEGFTFVLQFRLKTDRTVCTSGKK